MCCNNDRDLMLLVGVVIGACLIPVSQCVIFGQQHGIDNANLMTLAGVIVGACLTYFGQSLLFKQQQKKDVEKLESEIIYQSVSFLNKSGFEINHFIYLKDKERFKAVFEDGDHFPKLGDIRFQLSRLGDNEILKKFDMVYNAFENLGVFIDVQGTSDLFAGGKLTELSEKFNQVKKDFEIYCAGYTKLKK